MVANTSGLSDQNYPTSLLENMDMGMARMQRSFLEMEKQVSPQVLHISQSLSFESGLTADGSADGNRASRNR